MKTKEISCKFIADIGSNSNNNLDRCLQLIRTAKNIGCWGIKIQLFKADKLYAPGHIPNGIKERELPERWIPILSSYCKEIGIKFGGTPFHLEAVDILAPYVDFLKISSFDILREDLIEKCVLNGFDNVHDLIISTGMASIKEVLNTRQLIKYFQCTAMDENIASPKHITYLHCISNYPTYPDQCHLERINELDYQMNIHSKNTDIGWSDHTTNPSVIYEAYCRGAKMIEFHLDIDGKGSEFRYGHCYLPQTIGPMIRKIQKEIEGSKIFNVGEEKRDLRADPSDGLRPMKSVRK